MKKASLSLLLAALLLLASCGGTVNTAAAGDPDELLIAAATYPVYLFTQAVTQGVENVGVQLVTSGKISCLHDYTLTVDNMRVIEGADMIVRSGAGLDTFLDSALPDNTGSVIDCSAGIDLLTTDAGEPDPHIWLDPERAAQMVLNLADGLAELDPDHAGAYLQNGEHTAQSYRDMAVTFRQQLKDLSCRELVTFHDGFAYFADAFDLTILKAIEEEAGSEASAKDISEVVTLIREHNLPAIFAELNGSSATADAIAREFDPPISVSILTTIMSEDELAQGADDRYLAMMEYNVNNVLEALS
jgi:ABC-type Zn uptake system ZnuABC Zn-binding protein ZnuA